MNINDTNPTTAERARPRRLLGRLGLPRLVACAAVAAVVATVPVAAGSRTETAGLPAPTGLTTFLKSLGDSRQTSAAGIPEFARTPAFAWTPIRGATRYEFELSTSPATSGAGFTSANGLVWSSRVLQTPATAIPLALPWITGEPASLYWHVRAIAGTKVSAWSETKAFNMRWADVPKQLSVTQPGYIRWSPVDGATGYQVWWVRAGKVIATITNVADEREFYAFHDDPTWTGDVAWRVRAVRAMYGHAKNALPAVSYGPWSPVYHSLNASNPLTTGTDVMPVATVSDVVSDATKATVHSLMPAFLFSGNGATNYGLHRVYVFSDRDCVNVVFRGAVVAGPAYAPRTTGPLALPASSTDLAEDAPNMFLKDGDEGLTFAADTDAVSTSEQVSAAAGGSSGSTSGDPAAGGSPAAAGGSSSTAKAAAKVDLWDRNWPSGRYYWTVVPVQAVATQTGVEYRETELPQDNCEGQAATPTQPAVAPRMLAFGKHSADPKPTGNKSVPYATGLSPSGKLVSASRGKISFYGSPLVAWTAAPSASSYVVEWSKSAYPWRPAGHVHTPATSAVLPLTPGTWYYRVRGVDESIPGNQNMQWSGVARVRIAEPTFAVVKG
jgi:hypothetical protein